MTDLKKSNSPRRSWCAIPTYTAAVCLRTQDREGRAHHRVSRRACFPRRGRPALRVKEENDSHTFLFIVDSKTVIDAGTAGNDARFFNHSCDPNCESVVEKRRVFIEAMRAIEPGEEMTYDYQIYRDHDDPENIDEVFACRCGFANCRGTMLWPPEPKKKKRSKAAAKKERRGGEEVRRGRRKKTGRGKSAGRNKAAGGKSAGRAKSTKGGERRADAEARSARRPEARRAEVGRQGCEEDRTAKKKSAPRWRRRRSGVDVTPGASTERRREADPHRTACRDRSAHSTDYVSGTIRQLRSERRRRTKSAGPSP